MEKADQFIHREFIESEYRRSQTYHYLNKYMSENLFDVFVTPKNANVKSNKTIWVPWLQGIEVAPLIVQECVKSIQRNKPDDFDLVIVTEANIEEYIIIPTYIKEKYEKGIISKTHMADFMRMELLCMYGGCWIDATVYCGDKIPLYMLSGELFIFKSDIVAATPVIKMSSWWIYAKKMNRLIKGTRNILHQYWKEEEEEIKDYYLIHLAMSKLVDEDTACGSLYRNIPYFSNSNCHVLFGKLGSRFDDEQWKIIKDASKIQKLSFKRRYIQGDLYTFYSALFDGKLV